MIKTLYQYKCRFELQPLMWKHLYIGIIICIVCWENMWIRLIDWLISVYHPVAKISCKMDVMRWFVKISTATGSVDLVGLDS